MTQASRGDPRPPWVVVALGDLALATVLAAVLLTTSLAALLESDLGGGWRQGVAVLLMALHAALLGRSRWPVASFAIASAAMLGLALAPDLGGPAAAQAGGPYAALLLPSGLVFFVSLYTVSARTTIPVHQIALAVGLVGAAITVARLWDAAQYASTPVSGRLAWRALVAAAVVAGVAAAWSLGRYRATRLAWVAALEERAERAERDRLAAVQQARADLEREADRAAAAERRRIAREMHDVVAHSLAVVVGQAEGGRMLVRTQPDGAADVLSTIAEQGRRALTEMRSLFGVLRDDEATSSGPPPRLDELDRVVDAVRRAGTPVEVIERGRRRSLPAAADLAAFRVVQESLTNVVKHAGPGASATVAFDWSDTEVVIRVADQGSLPGAQARLSQRPIAPGRGLLGLRERLTLVGGDLVRSGPDPVGNGGFVVEALVPTSPAAGRVTEQQPRQEGPTS